MKSRLPIILLAALSPLLFSGCGTVPVDPDDQTPPTVTLKQIANPPSRTMVVAGTPGSRPLQEIVIGRDALALLGHGEDPQGTLRYVTVQGTVTTRCEGIFGTRELAQSGSAVPYVETTNQNPTPGAQAAPFLNALLTLPMTDVVDRVKTRCEPVYKIRHTEWVVGEFTASAANLGGAGAQTFPYRFLWRPCPEALASSIDLVTSEYSNRRLRIHSNNSWSTISLGRLEFPGRPVWSPCKDRIVFSAKVANQPGSENRQGSANRLYIVGRSGSPRELTTDAMCSQMQAEVGIGTGNKCIFTNPDWSAAGEIATSVQFMSSQGIPTHHFLVIIDPDAEGGPGYSLMRQSHNGELISPSNPVWSPYGDRVIMDGTIAPGLNLLQGTFITTPGFRSTCQVDIGKPMAWIAPDGPGGITKVAYESSGGVRVATLSLPPHSTGCPTVLSDDLLQDTRAGDEVPGANFTGGEFAFIRVIGNSKDLFSQLQSGSGVVKHLDINRDTTGFDF